MTKKLDEIRNQIDDLDNRIHDLLMERASLIGAIIDEKKKGKLQIVQPAREAVMIRRLLGRHEGDLPKAAIVRIWRELVGAVTLLQTGLKVAVTVTDERSMQFWDMARDYFGSVLPMVKVSNPLAAVGMVREGEATFAVVPWPQDGAENPWWIYLNSQEQNAPRVVVRLPYGDIEGIPTGTENMALIVSNIAYDETGDDMSFLALEIDQSVSRARIVDKAKKAGLVPVSLNSRKCPNQSMPTMHLLEVEGYVDSSDSRLQEILADLEDPYGRIACIGGYPKPPIFENLGNKVEITHKRVAAE